MKKINNMNRLVDALLGRLRLGKLQSSLKLKSQKIVMSSGLGFLDYDR